MNTEQKDEFRFRVVKYWATAEIRNKTCGFNPRRYDTLQNELNFKELSDAQCLLRMIFKEVDSYNAKIKSKVTLLENLKYKRKWESSACFYGLSIPWRKIDDLITNNPGKEVYEIFSLLHD